jgi:hypothetical protein
VVVVAAEAKTTSRSLIAISDVEGVFNDEIVKELARTAKLPADVDIARWAQSIRIAARSFLEEKAKLNLPQLRTAIERLYQLNTRAEKGNDRTARALARAVDAMPADVRQWLLSCNTPHDRNIPTATEILSPATRQSAVERFRLILSYGGSIVAGRKRSGGRRSRIASDANGMTLRPLSGHCGSRTTGGMLFKACFVLVTGQSCRGQGFASPTP